MNNSRLELLLQYHQDEPDDPFNAYALALEYLNIDKEKAKIYFDLLLLKHNEYLPTYYHAADFYKSIDKFKAEDIFKKGIALAQQQNNHHALRELKNSYSNFLYDDDGDED